MSARRPSDDEVDRLLREALADDMPEALESELRRDARRAWRRAAAEPRRARWWDGLGIRAGWRPLLPQPALVAAALAMLAAGTVMQAAPAPPEVVESFLGRQAWASTSRALGRATAMECTLDLAEERGQRLGYRVSWRTPGEARVRLDGPTGSSEHTLRVPGDGSSVLTRAARRDTALPDVVLRPARAYLSPSALGSVLDATWRPVPGGADVIPGTEAFVVGPGAGPPGLTVTIDVATHLPLRLDATDRDGRVQTAVCRWP
jgi:hypothetical protein